LLDYVQEDIEGMKKELDMWRKEAASHHAQLADETL
jgi:hypothetical protein